MRPIVILDMKLFQWSAYGFDSWQVELKVLQCVRGVIVSFDVVDSGSQHNNACSSVFVIWYLFKNLHYIIYILVNSWSWFGQLLFSWFHWWRVPSRTPALDFVGQNSKTCRDTILIRSGTKSDTTWLGCHHTKLMILFYYIELQWQSGKVLLHGSIKLFDSRIPNENEMVLLPIKGIVSEALVSISVRVWAG